MIVDPRPFRNELAAMYEITKAKGENVLYPTSLLCGDVEVREIRGPNYGKWAFLLQRGEQLRWISTAAGQEVPDDLDSIDDTETAQLVSDWKPRIEYTRGEVPLIADQLGLHFGQADPSGLGSLCLG